ncbi:hypothetical protein DPMN_064010 [Dreissena polymorpha]|uniref:Uncharacterized protein n=1 Tax=Dreissena polymorpha TaxID=45954 RepID=A0A9D4CCN8_DREPO|nr:hypothetical protein DPMN_064010 [Dreissena polymorpha]
MIQKKNDELPYRDAKAIGDSSLPNVTRREITQRAQAHVHLIEHYLHRWSHIYLTSPREFQTKGGNKHQTIRLGNLLWCRTTSNRDFSGA